MCFGLDPTVVSMRRARHTYGVGVVTRFQPALHPADKRVERDGAALCRDVFDPYVVADQTVAVGDTVTRRYAPASAAQTEVIIHVYAAEASDVRFVTDEGVRRCGTLRLELGGAGGEGAGRREIEARMTFGGTEISATATDVATGRCVRASIDFLNK